MEVAPSLFNLTIRSTMEYAGSSIGQVEEEQCSAEKDVIIWTSWQRMFDVVGLPLQLRDVFQHLLRKEYFMR
jgi:hypothetical protein